MESAQVRNACRSKGSVRASHAPQEKNKRQEADNEEEEVEESPTNRKDGGGMQSCKPAGDFSTITAESLHHAAQEPAEEDKTGGAAGEGPAAGDCRLTWRCRTVEFKLAAHPTPGEFEWEHVVTGGPVSGNSNNNCGAVFHRMGRSPDPCGQSEKGVGTGGARLPTFYSARSADLVRRARRACVHRLEETPALHTERERDVFCRVLTLRRFPPTRRTPLSLPHMPSAQRHVVKASQSRWGPRRRRSVKEAPEIITTHSSHSRNVLPLLPS